MKRLNSDKENKVISLVLFGRALANEAGICADLDSAWADAGRGKPASVLVCA